MGWLDHVKEVKINVVPPAVVSGIKLNEGPPIAIDCFNPAHLPFEPQQFRPIRFNNDQLILIFESKTSKVLKIHEQDLNQASNVTALGQRFDQFDMQ